MGDLIHVKSAPVSENVSPGVTPGIMFSRSGTTPTGSYLKIGDVISGPVGQPIFGKNRVVKLRVTNGNNVVSNTVLRLQQRTGLNTVADISGAEITIPAGSYSATVSIDVALQNDPELCCYIVSGSSLQNPVVIVFLYPDYS